MYNKDTVNTLTTFGKLKNIIDEIMHQSQVDDNTEIEFIVHENEVCLKYKGYNEDDDEENAVVGLYVLGNPKE